MSTYINSLTSEKSDLNEKINIINSQLKTIYNQEEDAKRLKDLNIRRGKVIGKVELYLESISVLGLAPY